MPMTQDDIRRHYEQDWKAKSDAAADADGLRYSNPVEDAVLYPAYERLLRDLNVGVDGGAVLDVGSGSGRWVRYFLERFRPARLLGVDYTQASVDLLNKWCATASSAARLEFRRADITEPNVDFGEKFDLVNIANVLFHIPETDRFTRAVQNLARHLKPAGRIVTTEYLPRTTMRTQWMLVRSRYEFEAIAAQAGLRIVDVRPTAFFCNDPMGIDGPDAGARQHFNLVRNAMQHLQTGNADPGTRQFLTQFFTEIEKACLSFCGERMSPMDLPSQKLVVLAAK
jgi:SAM-dependent methyltransferase